jgi:hypothetical protein
MNASRALGLSHVLRRCLYRQHGHRFLSRAIASSRNRSWRPLISSPHRITCRSSGTKTHKAVEELPQGLQAPLEPFVEKDGIKYSPVLDEVLQNQRRFPKCVLLTRLGQFYEVSSRSAYADNSCIFRKRRKSRLY